MTKHLGLAALTLVGGLAATGSAFAQGMDYHGPLPTYAARNPARFGERLHTRINDIDGALRRDVHQGRVNPAALTAFTQQRQRIEWSLQRASADGVIVAPERMRLNRMVDRLDRLDTQYRVRTFGGGPAYWRNR